MSGRARPPGRVIVVGGGWAGCTAALALAEAGLEVALYEHAPQLGGRARGLALDGLHLDNGQHLLLGAYRSTLGLLASLHGAAAATVVHRQPLALVPFGRHGADRITVTAARLPAPWHLGAALLMARGFTLREKGALVRDLRRLTGRTAVIGDEETVADRLVDSPPRVVSEMWAPLCLAALNTPPERASAGVFAAVLREAFLGHAAASDFIVPALDLGALLPEPAARRLAALGATVQTGVRVQRVARSDDGIVVDGRHGTATCDALVIAVGPHQVHAIEFTGETAWRGLQQEAARWSYEPITTVYLAYGDTPPMARVSRLDDRPGQWIFDRGTVLLAGSPARLVAVVISASGPHDAMPQDQLAAEVDGQLRRLAPELGEVRFRRVIAERRATYACLPGMKRPEAGRLAPGLHLAGDYTIRDLPATLESAVRSGVAAAKSVRKELGV